MQPGTDTGEAIVKGTPRELYVTEMMGFQVQRGDGRLLPRRGGLLDRGGELAYPVGEVTISLNVDTLWRIDAVGSDLDMRTATAAPTVPCRR